MTEQLSFSESISGLITKQKGRTLKYAEEIRRVVSPSDLRIMRANTCVPIALLFGIPLFAVVAYIIGAYVTHSERVGVPFNIAIAGCVAYLIALTYETAKISAVMQKRVEPALNVLEVSIPLMTPMYPLGVAFRLLELAAEYNSLCRKRANTEVFVTRVVEETGLSREVALAEEAHEKLRMDVRLLNEEVEKAKTAFWKFVDMTYDEAAPNFVVSTIQLPPRPKKWRDALALGPWIDEARTDLYARLDAGNPEESVPPIT